MPGVADSVCEQQKKQRGRREGGTPAHIKACKVSGEQIMETEPGIKHSPAGDPLARGKVVDKLSHFYSSFPHCSQFSHFIYPV